MEDVFSFCKENYDRYVYCEAFVCLTRNSNNEYCVYSVDWAVQFFGIYDEDLLNDEIYNIEDIEVEKEGWYMLRCLFTVDTDSDDYRTWTYLTPEEVEFKYQISIEEAEAEAEALNDISDLFKFK